MELSSRLQKIKDALLFKGNSAARKSAENEASRVEIARFDDTTREQLRQRGCLIYPLTQRTISEMEAEGVVVRKNSLLVDLGILDQPSILSEVAFDPLEFFIPNSLGTTEDADELLVAEIDLDFGVEMPGASAMKCTPADYLELAEAHRKSTGEQLFKGTSTRTTAHFRGMTAFFGEYSEEHGYQIQAGLPEIRYDLVGIAPLIVPADFY